MKIDIHHISLEIETSSYCNRRCPTCVRNSNPDRAIVNDWFGYNYMPMDTIIEIIRQVHALGYRGGVCLSHYNEPLLDTRMPEIIRQIKKTGYPGKVSFCSNGTALTKELAGELNGLVDAITFGIYLDEPLKSRRELYIQQLLPDTALSFIQGHIITHHSPIADLEARIAKRINEACFEPTDRLIFNHKGQVLLCCEEVADTVGLPSFPEKSIVEILEDENYINIIESLKTPGNRAKISLCSTCPR